ncbi:MAG: hypothetical protein ACI4HI_05040 [Lachnospiraceae bacterium]
MVLTEFDEEDFAKTMREEGIIEGIVLSGIGDNFKKFRLLKKVQKTV